MINIVTKIYKYLRSDFLFVIKLLFAYVFDLKKQIAVFYSDEEFSKLIVQGKSIIRFGDGETSLILGESIHFQKFDTVLAKHLKTIVTNYKKDSRYVLCVAKRYIQATNKELKYKNIFNCWFVSKVYFEHAFNKNVNYGDAHSFYVNGYFEKNITPFISNKKIIVVTKKQDIKEKRQLLDSHFEKVIYIEIPEKDSFSKLQCTLQEIIKINQKYKDIVVLASAGPMGKVLAYNLLSYKIQTIDIGHGIATLFNEDKSLEKVLV